MSYYNVKVILYFNSLFPFINDMLYNKVYYKSRKGMITYVKEKI
jgi:hypothetical protein